MINDNFEKLIKTIDTPFYTFDVDDFKKRVLLVKKEFGPKTHICFSIKANPFLLKYLPLDFERIEVCSPGELTICEKIGIDTSKIIFSGVNKTEADVIRAMKDKVGIFTAESFLHVSIINKIAVEMKTQVPVLLRLTGGSQFGMNEDDIIQLVENRNDYNGVEFVGIHYFTGTQKRKPATIEKELSYVMDFIEKVYTDTGFRFKKLEYGTGLAVDYFSNESDQVEFQLLESISSSIRNVSERIDLTVEMGRFFAAPCGYYFTKVVDLKTNCGINYAILDGGLNQIKYHGQIQGMQIPLIHHIHSRETKDVVSEKWTLCGSLCTTADVLARNAEFSDLQIGDILVFCRTGAYSVMEGMSIFLSREMPIVSAYSEQSGIEILRDRLYTDVFNTPRL